MAYQPKSYRKFVATAATATLVASAVAPLASAAEKNFTDVSTNYKEAVDFLVSKGINGTSDTTFGTTNNITRVDAAVMLATVLELDMDNAPDSGFTDVPKRAVKAVNAIKAAGITSGKTSTTLDSYSNITRGELAVWIQKGFELKGSGSVDFKDVNKNYVDAVSALVENKVTSGKTTTTFGTDLNATRGEYAIFLFKADAAKTPAVTDVESVSATNAKTIAVNFTKELTADEKKDLAIEVKKGDFSVTTKIDSVEGKVAKVVRTNGYAFEEGTYTVTVKGLKETVVKTLEIKAQTPTTLAVANDKLLGNTAKAKVGLELKDQYGEKIDLASADFEVVATNATQAKTVTVDFDTTDKYFYIDTTSDWGTTNAAFKADDEVKVTFLHKKTGLKTTASLKVVAGAQLATITTGAVELPTGKTVLTSDLTNVTVPVAGVDQYGNALNLVATGGTKNINIVSSDNSILNPSDVTVIQDPKDATKQKLNIASFGKEGKVNLYLVNTVTGDTTTIALDVQIAGGKPNTVAFETGSVDVAKGGTADVKLTVSDIYGNALTGTQVKTADSNNEFTIYSSNKSVATAAINSDGTKLTVTPASAAKVGDTATITFTVNATGKTTVLNVKVGETVAPNKIKVSADSKHKTNLIVGATTTIKFDTLDNYDNKLTTPNGDLEVKYSIKETNNTNVSLSADSTDETNASVEVSAVKAGSATVVAKFVDTTTSKVIDAVEIPVNVVENTSTGMTYAIEAIPTLYKEGTASSHTEDVIVKATDASGKDYAVPADDIVSITSSDAKVKFDRNKVYADAADITADLKAKITVVYNTKEGIQTLTTDVTVSKDDLRAEKVLLMDKTLVDTTAKALEPINADAFADVAAATGYVIVEDQFGEKVLANSVAGKDYDNIVVKMTNKVNFTDASKNDAPVVTDSTGAIDLSTLADNTKTVAQNAASFRLVFTSTANAAATLEVTVK
ncbi:MULTISPECIES: S-layer homology domain-containing protein [Bacillus]|uniref:S-layer homology domain-containing protein n=1 Tax=Bacillus TaxID=1386 RepID=UPI000303D6AC|nr:MULTISPECIES: S-layer homology domain-containing protein [Bacillus]